MIPAFILAVQGALLVATLHPLSHSRLRIVLFALEQMLLWCLWFRLVSRRRPDLPASSIFLQATVFYFSQVIGTSLLLGWSGLLTRFNLVCLNTFVCLAAGVVGGRFPRAPRADWTSKLQSAFCPDALGNINKFLAILLAAVLFAILYRGENQAPYTYDELHYHMPMVLLMHQNHTLDMDAAHDPIMDTYPKNIHAWFHWIVSFFHNDKWVDVGQIPFLFLGLAAVFVIARHLGSSASASMAAALVFPFAPVLLSQLNTAYIDVAVTALLLAAAALLLRMAQAGPRGNVAAFGCCVGLLAGTKYSGIVYAVIFLTGFAAVLLFRRVPLRRASGYIALAASLVVLLGGYAYVRNWSIYGNPFYPYQTSLPGDIELPGPLDKYDVHGERQTRGMAPYQRVVNSWLNVDELRHSRIYGGFGFAVFLILATAASAGLALRRREWVRLGIIALFLLLFFATPLHYRVRFVLYLLGLGAVSYVHILESLRGHKLARAVALVALAALPLKTVQQMYRAYYEPALFGNARTKEKFRNPSHSPEFVLFRDTYDWTRKHAGEADTVVVYPGPGYFLPYFMWSPGLRNRVEFEYPPEAEAFMKSATRNDRALFFIQKGSPVHQLYLAHGDEFEIAFDGAESLVARRREP